MRTMTAASIPQPYAWAIFYARLCVIAMPWATDHRGRLAIHSAHGVCTITRLDDGTPVPAELDYGCVLGAVDLVGCVQPGHPSLIGLIVAGPHCWIVGNAKALERPVRALGKAGLFQVDTDRIVAAQPSSFAIPIPQPAPQASLFDAYA